VSFLPVFFLTGRDYKLFAPLAWTKTFALTASLIVAVTVVPMLCRVFLRSSRMPRWAGIPVGLGMAALSSGLCYFVWGEQIESWTMISLGQSTLLAAAIGFAAGFFMTRERIRPIEENPISRALRWLYGGRLRFALNHKVFMLSLPTMIFILGMGAWFGLPTVLRPVEKLANVFGADLNSVPGYVDAKHVFTGLKSDDWIALDEGSWFYMPSLYPAASFNQAMEVLQTQDAMIKQIPEVENVLGKIGRAQSALDPAPGAMVETYVMLKPRDQWRPGATERSIWDEINAVATLPGVTPASPLQPIEGRVVMLQAGIKASMAVRVYGDSLDGLAKASLAVAEHLKQHHLVNAGTVNPDIVMGKPYFEFEVDREEAARYGMTTMMVNQIVSAGLGGYDVTTTVEGRERYPIQIRFSRNVREKIAELHRVPVVTDMGDIVPLERLASVATTWGPGMINSEDSRLVAHVMFSPSGSAGDLETVDSVMKSLTQARESGKLQFPPGNFELQTVGSFQNQIEANRRLMWIIPMVVLINFLLIYLEFRNVPISLAVFAGLPVSFAGGMIMVAAMGVELNTAVWVGFIATFGLAEDDGVVMATYIRQLLRRRSIRSIEDVRNTIHEAGLKRIRPCMMTTITTLIALMPVIWATGRGADVARAMAWPVLGGMLVEPFASFIVPTIYCAFLEFKMRSGLRDELFESSSDDAMPEHTEPIAA
jgi:Cu(I)/Ag(I) efflux system membrane protein CusA/SilA